MKTKTLKWDDLTSDHFCLTYLTSGEYIVLTFRRMRRSILEAANNIGAEPDTKVVLAGMANVYTHYITTFEEYQVQVSHH